MNKETIKSTVEVDTVKKLIDLNGSKVNFYSEFMIDSKNPKRNFLVAVLDQDDLDNGSLNFEPSTNGQFARSIIYQNNVLKNHFIAVKRLPDDKSKEALVCDVIRVLEKLPMIEQSKLKEQNISPETEEKKMISDDVPSDISETKLYETEINQDYNQQLEKLIQSNQKKGVDYTSPSFIIGIICLLLFFLLLLKK
jgi:hypothetical protein